MCGKNPQRLKKTSSTQKANKLLGSEGVESNDTIKIDEPVTMHTRLSTNLQHPSKVKRPWPFQADYKRKRKRKVYSFNSFSKTSSNKTGSLIWTWWWRTCLSCNYLSYTCYIETLEQYCSLRITWKSFHYPALIHYRFLSDHVEIRDSDLQNTRGTLER